MTISGIKTNVQSLLTDSGYFQTSSVLSHPPTGNTTFSGYPAACHYYDGTDPQFATVSQNRRVIEYVVELYLVSDTSTTEETKFDEMYDLTDNIVQMFAESQDLSRQTEPKLARACDILRPAPGKLQRVTTNEGDGLMVTIRLFCEADVSFV